MKTGAQLPSLLQRMFSLVKRALAAMWLAASAGVAKLSSLMRRVPPPMRRALAVVGLAALAGLAALVVLSDEPKTYEVESSFAIRPSDEVQTAELPDVVGTLAEPDNAVTETIVNILGSELLRDSASEAAGLPLDSVGESGAEYSWTASRRPGSAIIDIRLTGPSDEKLLAMQAAAAEEAARLVGRSYGLYRLEALSSPTSPDEVDANVTQKVALAIFLGALLGLALVLAERRLRSSLGARPLDRRGDGRPSGTDDPTDETDRLESTLRESLGTDASVRRVGASRIEVAPPEAAPGRIARRER
jgi:hypothetical protein